ncbi:hypothetical protein [Sporomusa sphaeroides]|uniref:hypothetical protein n=1 Tax=Sporomusa sphaeroides TaxID=47679 RepID=UPI00202E8B90|nr:hypothetical protein [Sporomusa sphaeroides]MCM0757434.1 hypothetical protein [Sporomusa sphaeroides DSM 2875]HML33828.1 hypothetical protein [Sporomusa sphaeroides]
MKASDICAALRERYQQPEWSLFFEVGSGTGGNCRRHADALAMNMYPSRGLSIVGMEIKVSRGDLKRELVNPDKAEEIARYCDEWYLVVPKGLVREDDMIPTPWGVMECEDGKLRITKKAERLPAQPVTKEFMAAVVRCAGRVDAETLQNARNEAYREQRESYERRLKDEVERRTKSFEELKQQLADFEKATGKSINRYTDVEILAENIKLAENIEILYRRYGGLQTIRGMMEDFLQKTSEIVPLKEAGQQ